MFSVGRERVHWEQMGKTFLAHVSILHPLKTSKTFGFMMYSGGKKWEHWPEMA